MKRQRYFIIGFITISTALLLTSSFLSNSKLNITKGLANIFTVSNNFDLNEQIRTLQRENANLRSRLNGIDHQIKGRYVVYSSYPFNNRSEIVIGDINDNEVTPGDTVVDGDSILVGKIKQLSGDQAIVTTVFDPSFETAARIGEGLADALFKGGNSLELSLIPEDALIEVGDVVYTSSKDFPYGLEIGTIASLDPSQGTPFRTAIVDPAFAISTLRYVGIID